MTPSGPASSGFIAAGEIIQEYPDDRPLPSRVTLGWVRGRPLHIVSATDSDNETTVIIAVYEPDHSVWDGAFRRKK